jgi:hypothetical protein
MCSEIIGDTADIFETERDDKRAFLVVTERTVPINDNVLKHLYFVLKQCAE